MFTKFLFVLLSVFCAVSGERYDYEPSHYIGEVRVPANCEREIVDCPRSWKSGIPEGSETAPPMIYQTFFTCHEGFTLCGYVPIDPETGEVLGNSGVTIGAGVDLGSKTSTSFKSLPSAIVDKLEPYFGLKRNLAACAAIERPLNLSLTEARNVTDAMKDFVVIKVSSRYDADKDNNSLEFESLPRGIRTAIVSVWYQFGYPEKYPRFWGFVTNNDWNGAIKELRNFYKKPEEQARGDLIRRNNEADIVEATLAKCNRSIDVVFLLDESGSVSRENFNRSLDFVKSMIKAFPDNKLKGNDSTRFGLSSFSNYYKPHFYLSSYTNQLSYLSAVSRVSYTGAGTFLGAALQKILVDQFTEERGLRPEVDGLPRILIIVTDGKASDSVSIPAKNVRDKNIVVYAIGIGGYDTDQLNAIASSKSHVYELSTFFDLDKFIGTITSSTCNEPRPVSLNNAVETVVSKDAYLYFSYVVDVSSNLMIKIKDLNGSTIAYASRSNPHPYKYDHDISFDLSKQKNKVIIIAPTALTDKRVKRSTENETTAREIYVSVTSDTDSASFTIEGAECNPLNCTEGTNEIPVTTQFPTTTMTATSTNGTDIPPATTPESSAHLVMATKLVIVSVGILISVFETHVF